MPLSSVLRLAFISGTFLVVAFGVYYQAILQKILLHGGYWRLLVEGLNNEHCERVPGLEACEKLVRLKTTGLIYLSCSSPIRRTFWEPATGRLNATGRSLVDHVAFYNPSTSRVIRLQLIDFPSLEPLALHGFDIIPSETNPSELFLFAINHRPPSTGAAAKEGADSVIEIFKTQEGSSEMKYIKTIRDPKVIITPSDIAGNGDGSFYFTNNARSKTGIMRKIDPFLRLRTKSIGFCTYEGDCTLAATGLSGASGILRGPEGVFYVTNNDFGEVILLEQADDKSLDVVDTIYTEMPMDKLSLDEDDVVHVAAFPKRLQAIGETLNDPSISSASAVFRITRNTGDDQFYGKKFRVDKIFQDDGSTSSLSTTAAYDPRKRFLYTTGSRSQFLSICKIPMA